MDISSDLDFVQNSVKTWSDRECVAEDDNSKFWTNVTFWAPKPLVNSTLATKRTPALLAIRDDCSTIQAVSGDNCKTLAGKCYVSGSDFAKYNSFQPNLCSTLMPSHHVCCSTGTLPSFSPKPNSDGTCASYLIISQDTCSKISQSNSLTIQNLEDFNSKTWGWTGCSDLLAGIKMCLSTGAPPMPAPISNAVCGPQVPGTSAHSGVSLASLNPCAINACCDDWG